MDGEVGAGSECKVVNLSRSGICLAIRDPVAPGREVYIQLPMAEGPSIALLGQAVWVHPNDGSGFEIGCSHEPDGRVSLDCLEKLLKEYWWRG